jgi:hypothetical protein
VEEISSEKRGGRRERKLKFMIILRKNALHPRLKVRTSTSARSVSTDSSDIFSSPSLAPPEKLFSIADT